MFPLSRRGVLLSLTLLGTIGWSSAGAATTFSTLGRLGRAFSLATLTFGRLNVGLSWMLNSRASVWNLASARQMRRRLRLLSNLLTEFIGPNGITWSAIAAFHWEWSPPDTEGERRYPDLSRQERLRRRERHWQAVTQQCDRMLRMVLSMLDTLASEQSAFVNSEPYHALKEILEGRASLLDQLRRMDRPQSDAEFAALGDAIERYGELHFRLRETATLVDRYVLSLEH